jgi:cell division protease FtsH
MGEEERRRIAAHEAGHAVLAALLGKASDIHRISIVSHGRGLGATALQGDEDAVVLSEGQLRAQLVITLGGVAAEELVFADPSTGGDDDLEKVTELAREMVGKYGMSDLGKLRLLASDADRFLGAADQVGDLSGALHEAFDNEVMTQVQHALQVARDVLALHRGDLDTLVEALLERETLEGQALLPLLPPAVSNGSSIDLSRPGRGATAAAVRASATAEATPAPKAAPRKRPAKKAAPRNAAAAKAAE